MEYEVKINDFEGPLDLLLYLIKKSKVDIWNIKIEEITNQYLDYIKKMKSLNLDIASSYLVMASELIEMKSKLLLPNSELEDDSDSLEEDSKAMLINRLLEYQKYKNMVKDFQNLENERKQYFTKMPDNLTKYCDEVSFNNSDLSANDLLQALEKFLIRKEEDKPLKTNVTTKEVSVEDRTKYIKKLLTKNKKVNFFDLFEVINREYVIVTFLAILEMAKRQELKIIQENNFEEIICEGCL